MIGAFSLCASVIAAPRNSFETCSLLQRAWRRRSKKHRLYKWRPRASFALGSSDVQPNFRFSPPPYGDQYPAKRRGEKPSSMAPPELLFSQLSEDRPLSAFSQASLRRNRETSHRKDHPYSQKTFTQKASRPEGLRPAAAGTGEKEFSS